MKNVASLLHYLIKVHQQNKHVGVLSEDKWTDAGAVAFYSW